MKIAQIMRFLKHENKSGISKKTNQPYSIDTLYFLDEDMNQIKLSVPRESTVDIAQFRQLGEYNIVCEVKTDEKVTLDVLSATPYESPISKGTSKPTTKAS